MSCCSKYSGANNLKPQLKVFNLMNKMGAASYMPAQYEIYGQERLYFVSDRRHVACSTPERFVGSFESVMWFFPGNGTCRNIWKIKAKGFIFFFFVLLTMPP